MYLILEGLLLVLEQFSCHTQPIFTFLSRKTVPVLAERPIPAFFPSNICVRHVTGNDEDYLRKIPRVVVQKSALYKGPL